MKRAPLKRRTPLQPGSNRLERSGPTLRRTRVNAQSVRRQGEAVLRRIVVASLLAEHPICQAQWACHGARAVEVHERLKRSRGGSIVDLEQSHAIAICRACHELTEAEVAEATRRRMLLPSWHRCPPVGPC